MSGAKGIREIQRKVGGSNSTIYQRIREFLESDLIKDEHIVIEDIYGKAPSDMRLISLKVKGRELAESIVKSGFARPFCLPRLRERWIIATLLACKEIQGTTRLMKLLFLLKNEAHFSKKELAGFYIFRPGKYGPFSRGVERDLLELTDLGIIKMVKRKIPLNEFSEESAFLHIYRVAQTRTDIVEETLQNLPVDVISRLTFLDFFNRMTLLDLLKYVYSRYLKSIKNSIIIDKVLSANLEVRADYS